MARKPRIHIPGGLYHVLLRGNGGQEIFFEDPDRYRLYLLIQEGVERYSYRVHAFCCMPNHLHLAIQVAEVPLSKIMQNLSFRYTRWINQRRKRLGHLFQGRYKAILVNQDQYLLELVRYIHLNPVRAKLVTQPAAYQWSSHRAYLGKADLSWLTTDWVLSQFGTRIAIARRRYDQFVTEGMEERHREEFYQGLENTRILGEDRFIEEVLRKANVTYKSPPTLGVLIQQVCQTYGMRPEELSSPGRTQERAEARGVVAWLAVRLGSGTLKDVAEQFGRDGSTMSMAVRRIEDKAKELRKFERRLHRLMRYDYSTFQA